MRKTRGTTIQIIARLRRRKAFRVAAAYFVAAWLVIQVSDILLGNFGAPDWVFKTLVLALAIGFPVALFFVWLYDVRSTRGAVVPSDDDWAGDGSMGSIVRSGLVATMAVALIWLVWDKIGGDPDSRANAGGNGSASIAVLPFADMSADGDQEYFADGLSEEILNLLAGVEALKVSGRTSSFSFKGKDTPIPEIGEALGVAHVLEGSVRKAGDQVRVTAQLITTDDGFHLWSENFDRELTDIFAIQDEIAGAITSRLQLSLTGSDGQRVSPTSTSSIAAYELFLEARKRIQGRTVDGLVKARDQLGEAIALDPDFAPALAELALAWLMLSDSRFTPGDIALDETAAEAEPLLDRAFAAQPNLAGAHAVKGLMRILDGDPERADAALNRALELNASHSDALHWRALNLRTTGRLQDELAAREEIAEIDPLHLSNLFNLAFAHQLAGDIGAAMETARRMRRLFPDNSWGRLVEVEILAGIGELAEAYRIAEARLEQGDTTLQWVAAEVSSLLGRFETSMEQAGEPYPRALAGLGRTQAAIADARRRAQGAPQDLSSALGLMQTLSISGRHGEVLSFYQGQWGSLDALERDFRFAFLTEEMVPIVTAYAALGQDESLDTAMTHWNDRLEAVADEGFAMPYALSILAAAEALAGNVEPAIELLDEAIAAGYVNPLIEREPQFAGLRDRPEFPALVERNHDRINSERAKLGLDPYAR